MSAHRFNVAAVIAKIEWFYERGEAGKARELLLQPWPGMHEDMTSFYQHLIAAAHVEGVQPLLLKSCVFNEDGLTYRFPDWMIAAAKDLEGRYGPDEGRLRWQKATAVFAQLVTGPGGIERLEEACLEAARKMTAH
jgi:hypothetical protein